MEDINSFYKLVDRIGELLGQEKVPIIHLEDTAVDDSIREQVKDIKAGIVLIRNNIPVVLLSELDRGPGEPITNQIGDSETAFLDWFKEQSFGRQFYLYLSGLAHSADSKLGFSQRDEMGEGAIEPFLSAKCYVMMYDFNWESDIGYKDRIDIIPEDFTDSLNQKE